MKHICIFTIYVENYGAVLQTYALQRYLKRVSGNGCVQIADFYSRDPYRLFRKHHHPNLLKNIVKKAFVLLRYYPLKKRYYRERRFAEKEFDFTRRYHSVEELLSSPPRCDVYLTGSDQVFNENATYKKIFYQEFPKGNAVKAAYAPSFGIHDFSPEFEAKIKNDILDFDYLSCREESGARFLSRLCGREIPCVVDPTLLLSANEWSDVAAEPKIRYRYILVYDLNGGDNLIRIAHQIAVSSGFKIVCLTQKPQRFYQGIYRQIYSAGPKEFVGWIKNADYVVTDSFHGTMFSLIFGKSFYTYIAVEHSASRIVSVLDKLGLEDRIIRCTESFCFENNGLRGDYRTVLNEWVAYSQLFLNSILCEKE